MVSVNREERKEMQATVPNLKTKMKENSSPSAKTKKQVRPKKIKGLFALLARKSGGSVGRSFFFFFF